MRKVITLLLSIAGALLLSFLYLDNDFRNDFLKRLKIDLGVGKVMPWDVKEIQEIRDILCNVPDHAFTKEGEYTPHFEESLHILLLSMDEFHVTQQQIVLSQALLETDYFSSKVFIQNNNYFGMKEAYSRSLSLGTKNGHAYYPSLPNSVKDYATYQALYWPNYLKKHHKTLHRKYLAGNGNEDLDNNIYLEFLGKASYAEVKDYSKRVQNQMTNAQCLISKNN